MAAFDEDHDFVVVGCGGGSMCAGLVMRDQGKSVLIVEKTDMVGGSSARSGGVMWVPNNRFMARDGVPDSEEAANAYLDAVVGDHDDTPGATRERRQTYVAEATRMIDFLTVQGIRLTRVSYYPDYYTLHPGASEAGRSVVAELFNANELGKWRKKLRPGLLAVPAMLEEAFELRNFKQSWKGKRIMLRIAARATVAKLTGRHWISAGNALQGRMLQRALAAGIDIRTNEPVEELIIKDGRAIGIVTIRNGKPWKIGARLGVLVNAGGFAHNQRMRDHYQPGTSTRWTSTAPGDTGEMIEEMERHGAAMAQMEEFVGNQLAMPPGSEAEGIKPGGSQLMTASPHAILVDQSGVRYQNEGGSYMAFCKALLERNAVVPASPSWAIFDSQFIAKYMLAGSMPGKRKPRSWYEQGFLHRAPTIKALAQSIKIDPANLAATVDRFNGFVDLNRDEDFGRGETAYDKWLGDKHHKPSPTLGKLEKGPFYAVAIYPGDVGTFGGVVTDARARVLKEDGSVIEGLYATGVSTASVMGRAYPAAGCSLGPAFLWGYVAARHAAGLID